MARSFVFKQRFRHAREERKDEFKGSLLQGSGEAGRAEGRALHRGVVARTQSPGRTQGPW